MTALKLALAISAAITLAGCAKTDDSAMDTTAADTASGAMDATASPSTASPAATTGTAVGEPDQIHIVLREWSVRVAKSPIRAGRTTFHAMNEGTNQHAVEIEGAGGQEWKTDPIAPGATATLPADLTPGTYKVYCPIVTAQANHQQRGMSTTLVVQ